MDKRNENLLRQIDTAIRNALSFDPIRVALLGYGYTTEKLNNGLFLHDEVMRYDAEQQKEKGLRKQAVIAGKDMKVKLNARYKEHLELARLRLSKDTAAFTALQLGGLRKKTKSGNTSEMSIFYINLLANDAWLEVMAQFGVTKQKLEDTQKMLHQIDMVYSQQVMENGVSHNATKVRNDAMAAMKEWNTAFVKVARIALNGNPEMLEMLGIKTTKRTKK